MTGRKEPRPRLEDADLSKRLRGVWRLIKRNPEMPVLDRLELFALALDPPVTETDHGGTDHGTNAR